MISLVRENLETFKKSPDYIKNEIFIFAGNVFVFAILSVVLIKLQGLFLTGFIIGVLTVVTKIISLYSQKIKNMQTGKKYKFIVLFDSFYMVMLFFYIYFPVNIWLITTMLFGAVHSIFLTSFFIDYDVIMKETLSSGFFKKIQYLERFFTTVTAIIGAGIGAVLMFMFVDNNLVPIEITVYKILLIVAVLIFFLLLFEVKQYNRFYKDLNVIQDEKEDEAEDSHIIMTFEEFKTKNTFYKKKEVKK